MKAIKKSYQIILLFVILSLLFTLSVPLRKNIKMFFLQFLELPVFSTSQSVLSVKNKITSSPLADLKNEIALLTSQVVELDEIKQENTRLRALLDFKRKTFFPTIPVRIIEKDPSFLRKTVLVDKGRKDNLYQNMPVVSCGGLAGIVSNVGTAISRIILVNDPNFRVSVFIQRTRDEGVLEGSVQGKCTIKYLPLESDVKVDDLIVTSGLGKIFPKGILIGKVKKIGKDVLGMYVLVDVDLFADINHLEELLCIAN